MSHEVKLSKQKTPFDFIFLTNHLLVPNDTPNYLTSPGLIADYQQSFRVELQLHGSKYVKKMFNYYCGK